MTWLSALVIALVLALSSPSAFGQTATTTNPIAACSGQPLTPAYGACIGRVLDARATSSQYRILWGADYIIEEYKDGLDELWLAEPYTLLCHYQWPSPTLRGGKTCAELGLPHNPALVDSYGPQRHLPRPSGRSYPQPPPVVIEDAPELGTGPGEEDPEDPEPEEPETPQEPVGLLEVPANGSFQSGIGYVSGWVCEAERVSIVIDGGLHLPPVAREISRGDTEAICGDQDNGFILHWNYNLMGDGTYTAALVVDGKTLQENRFTVTTLGEEFVRGAAGECSIPDFPSAGETARFMWQEPVQGLVLVPPTD